MRPERAERVADIVERALDVEAGERKPLVAGLCGDDQDLLSEVASLLQFQEEARNFIETPAVEKVAQILVGGDGDLKAGGLVGDYRIISLLGEGGMGEVYLADDTSLGRKVAIKLLKFGLGAGDIVRHFHQEERILAGLTHPNIAQLYGGDVTANGRPYFVMEYVDGTRLDDYCRDKQLSISQRLALFRKICSAVSFAHQRLVIHRDLKPANIRVNAEGEPKLLDFGIARLLDPETAMIEQTMTLGAVMTPEYASPEQVRGENITTASDVYSLGVVLYEMLTEQKPYKVENRTTANIARAILEQEPTRPSSAIARGDKKTETRNPKSLRGDLDNIILKALRKEPERRYPSVGQFSEDLRRHVEGLPVMARKDTLGYRASKFITRNKVAVAAALLVLLAIVGGLIAALWEARVARRERAVAERRFDDVRRLADSLMFEIHDSVKNLQGSTPTRQLIVSRALEYLDRLAQDAGDNPALQRELATAYEKVGDIQGNPYNSNLGDTDGALTNYRKAVAIREHLQNVSPTLEAQMELGRSYRALGDILELKGDVAGTVANYRKSLSIFEELASANPKEFAVQDEFARAYEVLGDGLSRTDRDVERRNAFAKALAVRQALLEERPTDAKLRRSIGLSFLKLGGAIEPSDPSASDNVRRAIAMLEALAKENKDDGRAFREVGFGYYQLGRVLMSRGDFAGALESRRQAFTIRQAVAESDPTNAQAQFDFGVANGDLSEALSASGKTDEALEYARAALKIFHGLCQQDPTNAVYQRNLGLCYEKVAAVFADQGADANLTETQRFKDWTEARAWYEKATQLFGGLREHGTLMPSDKGEPQKFLDKVAECDSAIAELNKR